MATSQPLPTSPFTTWWHMWCVARVRYIPLVLHAFAAAVAGRLHTPARIACTERQAGLSPEQQLLALQLPAAYTQPPSLHCCWASTACQSCGTIDIPAAPAACSSSASLATQRTRSSASPISPHNPCDKLASCCLIDPYFAILLHTLSCCNPAEPCRSASLAAKH
jgi:hypothetical protein